MSIALTLPCTVLGMTLTTQYSKPTCQNMSKPPSWATAYNMLQEHTCLMSGLVPCLVMHLKPARVVSFRQSFIPAMSKCQVAALILLKVFSLKLILNRNED